MQRITNKDIQANIFQKLITGRKMNDFYGILLQNVKRLINDHFDMIICFIIMKHMKYMQTTPFDHETF